jgi:HEAT repeat protein
MGIFGPPNIKKMTARRDVKGLVKALGYQRDLDVRCDAAYALGKIGDPCAIEPLIPVLQDKDKDVHFAAAWALGTLRDPRAVGSLIASLHDWRGEIRARASGALVEVGEPAVEPLLIALMDKDLSVRMAAAEVLGRIGDLRAVEPLIAVLNDNRYDDVCKVAMAALGKIGDSRALEPLLAALKSNSLSVRQAAASALVKIYRSDKLSPQDKNRILKRRSRIMKLDHTDSPYGGHFDAGNRHSSCHQDRADHHDRVIGVDFPL